MTRSEWMTAVGAAAMCLLMAAGCSQTVDLNQVSPPAANALKTAFPDASVGEATLESGGELKLYEVKLTRGQQAMEATVSADGQIVEVESEVALSDVPDPVEDAVTKAVGDGKLFKLEKVEHRGKVQGGKVTMLDQPEVFYEAKYMRWLIMHETEWAPDGTARGGS